AGYVRVERKDGREQGVAVARLGPGQVFGEMSFLEEAGASASVIADDVVEVDVVEGGHVQSLLTSDPGFSARFYHSLAGSMAHRLRRTTRAHVAGLLGEGGAAGRFHAARTGQISERQTPAGLVEAVAAFKGALHGVARDLQEGRGAGDPAQARVSAACD